MDIMNLRDPVTSLKTLAEYMEEGKATKAKRAVVISVDDNGAILVYGYGDNMEEENCLALLSRASTLLINYLNTVAEEVYDNAG